MNFDEVVRLEKIKSKQYDDPRNYFEILGLLEQRIFDLKTMAKCGNIKLPEKTIEIPILFAQLSVLAERGFKMFEMDENRYKYSLEQSGIKL